MWIQISRVSHIWVNKLKQNLPVLMSFVWIASISAMPNGVTHCFHFEKLFTKQAEAWITAKAKQVLSHTCKYHSGKFSAYGANNIQNLSFTMLFAAHFGGQLECWPIFTADSRAPNGKRFVWVGFQNRFGLISALTFRPDMCPQLDRRKI